MDFKDKQTMPGLRLKGRSACSILLSCAAVFMDALNPASASSDDSRRDSYWTMLGCREPEIPMLDRPSPPGLHGRNIELRYVTGEDAMGDESQKAWRSNSWRNERVHGQFVVWSGEARSQLRAKLSDLTGPGFAKIGAENLRVRYVRYSLMRAGDKTIMRRALAERLVGDCLEDIHPELDLPANGFRPLWLTVNVPPETPPGRYTGNLVVQAGESDTLTFPIEINVLDRTLPMDNAFRLDFWQAPWSVARYHGVEPFSDAHYAVMEPLFRELAAAGQKSITAFLVDYLWHRRSNMERTDAMVVRSRRSDGTWAFDFSRLDRHVAFAEKCGLGPEIHCYSLLRFQSWRKENVRRNRQLSYVDEATGFEKTIEFEEFDSPRFRDYTAAMVRALESHAKEMGWSGRVFIGVDEMDPELVSLFARIIAENAPTLKLVYACDRKPELLKDIRIDVFYEALRGDFMSGYFMDWAAKRRSAGLATMFYVCNIPRHPNTWMTSDFSEIVWMCHYAAAKRLDGIARWSAFNWPRDPHFDGWSSARFEPGESFILYPGGKASVRWEILRDGIEDFRKIQVLRNDRYADLPELEKALSRFEYREDAKNGNLEYYRLSTGGVRSIIDNETNQER